MKLNKCTVNTPEQEYISDYLDTSMANAPSTFSVGLVRVNKISCKILFLPAGQYAQESMNKGGVHGYNDNI